MRDDRLANSTGFAVVTALAVGSLLPIGMIYGIPWLRQRAQQRRLTTGTTIIGQILAEGRDE